MIGISLNSDTPHTHIHNIKLQIRLEFALFSKLKHSNATLLIKMSLYCTVFAVFL